MIHFDCGLAGNKVWIKMWDDEVHIAKVCYARTDELENEFNVIEDLWHEIGTLLDGKLWASVDEGSEN